MNKATLEISEFIATHYGPCDLKTAAQVQARMSDNGCDYSECTKAEFEQGIREAYCSCAWEDGDNVACPVHKVVHS